MCIRASSLTSCRSRDAKTEKNSSLDFQGIPVRSELAIPTTGASGKPRSAIQTTLCEMVREVWARADEVVKLSIQQISTRTLAIVFRWPNTDFEDGPCQRRCRTVPDTSVRPRLRYEVWFCIRVGKHQNCLHPLLGVLSMSLGHTLLHVISNKS
jgi:hypothetical protein